MIKKLIEAGERMKAENEVRGEQVRNEYETHSYDFGPLPLWIQWLDKRLPKPVDERYKEQVG